MKNLHLKLNFSPASVLWCGVSYVTLKSIIGEYFSEYQLVYFSKGQPYLHDLSIESYWWHCSVQYLSVARGTEINFIDLETEFN